LAADALAAPIGLFRRRGRTYHAPLAEPVLPAELGIRRLLGLDDLPAFRPLVRPGSLVRLSDTAVALAPAHFATSYDVTALGDGGLDGTGSSLAVLGRSALEEEAVRRFGERFLDGPRPLHKLLAGTSNPGMLADPIERMEVLLDVQWGAALAPGAALEV